MKFTFNKYHFIAFVILFAIEILIATFLKSGFIRHTVGDFLVVILMYCFFKSFIKTNSVVVAIVTLGFAYGIEFLQLTDFLQNMGLKQNKWANLIFGNSFSLTDILAYTLGVFVIFLIDDNGKTLRFSKQPID